MDQTHSVIHLKSPSASKLHDCCCCGLLGAAFVGGFKGALLPIALNCCNAAKARSSPSEQGDGNTSGLPQWDAFPRTECLPSVR